MTEPSNPPLRSDLRLNRKAWDFHFEEYKQTKSEMAALLGRIQSLLRYSIIVTGATYTWLITNTMGLDRWPMTCLKAPKLVVTLGWLIPIVFVVGTGATARIARKRVDDIGGYLLKLENVLGDPSLGWEKHLEHAGNTITKAGETAWCVLLTVCAASSAVGISHVILACSACHHVK